MFEEAQLYSPVTEGEEGVVVHLGADHPGANDPEYRARRAEIAEAALHWSSGEPAPTINYTEEEQHVWRTVCRELAVKHERYACRAYREALAALDLPHDRIPQLEEVSASLEPLTGFRYVPAAGLVRSPSSTARWPTGSSTPPSTSVTRGRRCTRQSPT